MQTSSRKIDSNQSGLHPRLAEVVQRHQDHPDQSPPHPQSITAYEKLRQMRSAYPGPLVLDSFCGTGHSTALLARRHPEQLVVGIDKSADRLAKHQGEHDTEHTAGHGVEHSVEPSTERKEDQADNYLLLQARCEDIWRALVENSETLSHHYILYPNPWPKSAQLQRRVHGHPAFSALLRLGGQLELRSNWQTYVEEFGVAVALAGRAGHVSRVPQESPDMTLFERKYRQSGHPLWRFQARLEG